MTSPLGFIDVVVLCVYLASAIGIGLKVSGRTKTLESYLLGDRDLPWWAILGSIVATETSTATVLSVPGEAYGVTGMKFLQLALGYIVGRAIIVRTLALIGATTTFASGYLVALIRPQQGAAP